MAPARRSVGVGVAVLSIFASLAVLPVSAHGPLHEQIAALTAQIQQEPQNAALYFKRGELHSHQGKWEAALADYEQVAKLDPGLAMVDLARGKTLLVAGRYAEARAALDRFLANHPNHAEARAARARVLVKLGQNRAAVEDYTWAIDESLRRGRAIPEYYLERARACAADGDAYVSEALRGLDEGIQRLGPLVTLQLYAIDLELAANRYDAALARLQTLAAQSPRKEPWLARRGEILEQAGRAAEARLAYEQALGAIESLPGRHRKTQATSNLESQIRAALARHQGNGPKEADR